ncbi:hypothetical protein VTK26DRAFT_1685 [Humicola hyalothermophila]
MLGTTNITALRAVRAAWGKTWLSIGSSGASIQQRSLSTSQPRQVARIITFNDSSSPELKPILDTFRQEILLPTYLPGEQRKRLYKPKFKQMLQHDPVTMEIDGVVHKFRFIDRMQLPNTKKLMKNALAAMKTPADLQNLPLLLEGCKRAHRKLDHHFYNQITRKVAGANNLPLVLEMIKAVDKTGFKLNTPDKICEVLLAIQEVAIRSRWNKDKTIRAIRQTQLILNLLETDKAHKPLHATKLPVHLNPHYLALRLHLVAALAVHHQEGKDVDGKVTKYAEQLVSLWPEGKGLLDLMEENADIADMVKFQHPLLHRANYVLNAAPVLNGLTLAAQVVDPGLAMQLQNRADAVDAEFKTAMAGVPEGKNKRGEEMYKLLFGPQEEAE